MTFLFYWLQIGVKPGQAFLDIFIPGRDRVRLVRFPVPCVLLAFPKGQTLVLKRSHRGTPNRIFNSTSVLAFWRGYHNSFGLLLAVPCQEGHPLVQSRRLFIVTKRVIQESCIYNPSRFLRIQMRSLIRMNFTKKYQNLGFINMESDSFSFQGSPFAKRSRSFLRQNPSRAGSCNCQILHRRALTPEISRMQLTALRAASLAPSILARSVFVRT